MAEQYAHVPSDILKPLSSLRQRSLMRGRQVPGDEEITFYVPSAEMPQSSNAAEDQEKRELKIKLSLLEQQFKDQQIQQDADDLVQDTFSIMMTSKFCSTGWAFGFITFSCQITLIALILYEFFVPDEIRPVPVKVPKTVTAGQFFAVILSVLAQTDNFTAINSLIVFRKRSRWKHVLVDEGDDVNDRNFSMWLTRIFLPNFLKIIQGCLVLLTSFTIIVTSTDLIDLLKDFTALYFVSEIDNILFTVAAQGFLGRDLKERTVRVDNVKICEDSIVFRESLFRDTSVISILNVIKISPKFAMILILFNVIFGCWSYFALGQITGRFAQNEYHQCLNSIEYFEVDDTVETGFKLYKSDYDISNIDRQNYFSKILDKTCDGFMNTLECGFDGGDCKAFNLQYPNCRVPDIKLVGDGFCNGGIYNTIGCGHDGGDCDNCPPANRSTVTTTSLSVADLNADNLLDIIIGNKNTGNQILINDGNGIFLSEALNNTDGRTTYSSESWKQQNSKDSIIVFGNGGEHFREDNQILRCKVDKFLNITFEEPSNLPGGKTNTTSIAMGHMGNNIDGDPDIVVGNYGQPNQILWSTRKGDGNFEAMDLANDSSANTFTTDIKVVDINNDGLLDIIVANYGQPNQILVNEGQRKFKTEILPGGNKTKTKSISVVNINGTINHIVLGNYGEPNQLVWDEGNGTFNDEEIYELPSNGKLRTSNIRVHDMNSDTFPDLLITNRGQSNQVLLHSGSKHNYFYPTAIDLPCSDEVLTSDIIAADMDNHGFLDIIVANEDFQNNIFSNFLGEGLTYISPQGDRKRAELPEK